MNIESTSRKILAFRWIIIVIVAIVTIFLGFQIGNLKINADIISSLPDDDADAVMLKDISRKFGGNNMGIIILETNDIYQKEVLESIISITDTIGTIQGINSVTSLTNIINIKRGEFGFEIGKLVDEYELPSTQEELDQLRLNVLANDMYKGSIVSEDGTSTIIIFTLDSEADVNTVANNIIDATTSLNIPENIYYIGSPMLVTYISELMKSDLVRLLPIAFLLIAIILFLSFRSVVGVVYPLLTAVLAIIWSLGIMALLGYSMSMISNNIPIILLAVGTAYTIHVLNRVNQMRISGNTNPVELALQYIMVPVILAAVTTVIGFLSFIFGAYLDMIVSFGIFTALGTFFACLFSIFLIPSLLEVFGYHKRVSKLEETHLPVSKLSSRILIPLINILFKHPVSVLMVWIVLILVSIGGILLIERSVDIQDYFKKGNPTREAERIMIEKFGGTKPVFVRFTGDMQNPDVLKTMLKTGFYMEQSPDIYNTQSVANLILQLNEAVSGEKQIPDEQDKIEQLWFLLDGNEVMQRFVSEDLAEGIIISKFKSPDNESKKEFVRYMQKFILDNSTEDCIIEITGMPFVDITMDRSLINSQFGSIIIALIFVIIFVGIVLRSFYSGLYSSIPIIASIIILFGVMGITGIPLNIATVLVASVALGIGIDYSIHIISHFNHGMRQSGDVRSAIQDAITISGKAIIINVISVSTGFLILVFSDMVPLQYFGVLIALSMVGSSLGALTLLPAILIIVNRKKRKNISI